MSFEEIEHPRATDGKFAEKLGAAPEVTLDTGVPLEEIQLGPDNKFVVKYETFKDRTEVYVSEIESAVKRLENDEEWNRYLEAVSRQPNYSFTNQLLIGIQSKGTAEFCMAASKWKELGRFPRKGSTGYRIQAPLIKKVEDKDAAGNVKRDAKGKPVTRDQVIGFKPVPTFDIKQTSGEPLNLDVYTELSEDAPEGFSEDLTAAIESRGFKVSYVPQHRLSSVQGATSFRGKTVEISEELSPAERARTLAHELGHIAAGHEDRMDEYHTGSKHGGVGQRGAMEVEAESIAYVLMRSNGMQAAGGDRSGRYVAGWANVQKDDPTVVQKTGEKVARTVRELLGSRRWRNVKSPLVSPESA
jgi:antirestriction protein ArdC